MDLVTSPDDTELLLKATPLGLLQPGAHSLARRVDFIILLESFHSIPDSVPFSESGAVSLIYSLSGLASVLSQDCIWFQIWFDFYLATTFLLLLVSVVLITWSNHLYLCNVWGFFLFVFSTCFENSDFSWPLRHLLLFHHVPKWWFSNDESKVSVTA